MTRTHLARGVGAGQAEGSFSRPGAKPATPARPVATIGYVLSRFPQLSRGVALDEIVELERCGVDVHVFVVQQPGVPGDDLRLARRHASACDAAGMPVSSPAEPSASGRSPMAEPDDIDPENSAAESIRLQARWIASQVEAKQIKHLHAHLATEPTDVAREVKLLTGVTYSFTTGASEARGEIAVRSDLRDKARDADFVIARSDFSRKQLLAAAGGGIAQKIHLIYPGLDLARFRFHADPGRDPNSVLAVGPLVERSGIADLLEAIRILSDRRPAGVRLTIAEEGGRKSELRAKIASLGLTDRVTVLGRGGRSRLLSLMRVHAVMALPYGIPPDGDGDAVPAVLLEAMAVGLPVVSTAVMGIPEVLADGRTGRLISPHDPMWLAGALETLLDYPRVRVRMAQAAREKVERQFALSRNVAQLARLFADAVADRKIAI